MRTGLTRFHLFKLQFPIEGLTGFSGELDTDLGDIRGGGPGKTRCWAHARAPFVVVSAGTGPRSRFLVRFSLRVLRKGRIVLTSIGAATNMTITAWMTRTRSKEVWVMACIRKPPWFIAPQNRPARTMPSGLERPNRATVMASKPMVPTRPIDS